MNKRIFLFVCTLFFAHHMRSNNETIKTLVQKNIADYSIMNDTHKKFLTDLAYTKDIPKFLKDNATLIHTAPPKLLEAAYWIAYTLNKKALVQELLMIIESRGQ